MESKKTYQLRRVTEAKNFTLPKIKGKYVVLEVLAFIEMSECLEKLWDVSLSGRGYIVKNFREINNVMLKYFKSKMLDLTKTENLVSGFQWLLQKKLPKQTILHVKVPSILKFEKLCQALVVRPKIDTLEIDHES